MEVIYNNEKYDSMHDLLQILESEGMVERTRITYYSIDGKDIGSSDELTYDDILQKIKEAYPEEIIIIER